MSHFTVIVIGDDHEKQLAPYHEFECTGKDDQYVKSIEEDVAAYRKQYEAATETMLRDAEGNLHSFFDSKGAWVPEFSLEDTDAPFKRRVRFVPEGYTEVEVPNTQLQSFAEWLSEYTGRSIVQVMNLHGAPTLESQLDFSSTHKYGYIVTDHYGNVVKVIDRTNPNRKWDWYEVGGRWSGYFKLKPGAAGQLGRPGVFDNVPETGYVDIIKLGDLDLDGMRADVATKAAESFAKLKQAVLDAGVTEEQIKAHVPWSTYYAQVQEDKVEYPEACAQYNAQPLAAVFRGGDYIFSKPEDYCLNDFVSWEDSERRYVTGRIANALTSFAVVKDGKWYERGSMGWWGAVSDEKDRTTWAQEFNKLLDGLPADTTLTLVDCHI